MKKTTGAHFLKDKLGTVPTKIISLQICSLHLFRLVRVVCKASLTFIFDMCIFR